MRKIALSLFTVFAVYFLAAFVAWRFNPGDWHFWHRLFCALIMLLLGGVVYTEARP